MTSLTLQPTFPIAFEQQPVAAIREQLAQQDPSNTHRQHTSCKRLRAQNKLLEKELAILYRLRAESRLTEDQEGWIGTLEQAL